MDIINKILSANRDGTLSNFSDDDLRAALPICHTHIQAGHHWGKSCLDAVQEELRRREDRAAEERTVKRRAEELARQQRAMIFVDGTNLFFRLAAEKLIVPNISALFTRFSFVAEMREVVRIYLYSVDEQIEAALKQHGAESLSGIRVVRGDGIKKSDGNVKEKGVDALLVADLVYHAASRNCDLVVLISTDTDFTFAMKRVEDFGCRTAVGGVCSNLPERLKSSADRHFTISASDIINAGLGRRA